MEQFIPADPPLELFITPIVRVGYVPLSVKSDTLSSHEAGLIGGPDLVGSIEAASTFAPGSTVEQVVYVSNEGSEDMDAIEEGEMCVGYA